MRFRSVSVQAFLVAALLARASATTIRRRSVDCPFCGVAQISPRVAGDSDAEPHGDATALEYGLRSVGAPQSDATAIEYGLRSLGGPQSDVIALEYGLRSGNDDTVPQSDATAIEYGLRSVGPQSDFTALEYAL
ncbi:hypothetical protein K438DRAFT_1827176 [Mycena galopus ATCC 62051]|nr:hypothetical protein K438DRAFT_1827176 [Mycena galopus ATCC 62051]